MSYTPTDVFETFPQPRFDPAVAAGGKAIDGHRSRLMIRNKEGLTKTYNRVHSSDDSPGVLELRALHVALDIAVRDTFGWTDLDLCHGVYDTAQGARFTISADARVEVLDRLLELNHTRYAEEVAAGLHLNTRVSRRRNSDGRAGADAPRLL